MTETSQARAAQPEYTDSQKEELVTKILDLQEALMATLQRVESTRNDHSRLTAENQMLLQYVNNLMSTTGPPVPQRK
ncbi:uncharacterized protein EV422DRAFT_568207 [Fimicolochytrium jonesii]|uniref:uncharacterized protein n=1 Tax=Fimicolochytrium jonesii TaxID=1396493 RepID=UPI0022FF3825|nr:uncharacterized protein EV422DRAFT_568207 [Fimicolochytrium jonesii]KAI8820242.1 hypothetical protein EV422DRAFT_568207 [Fimicolochytrium jonesii]